MFLSIEIRIPRIILSIGSIAIYSHTNSLRTLSNIPSIINSDNTFFLFWDIILLGLYRWIQFQIETWFLLINGDKCCDAFRSDRPEKYNFNA
jgi:hypothetical protein